MKTLSAGIYYETARKTSLGIYAQSAAYIYEDAQTPDGAILLSGRWTARSERLSGILLPGVRGQHGLSARRATSYVFSSASEADRNSTSYQGAAGIRFPILGPLRGMVSLGYKSLVPRLRGMASYGASRPTPSSNRGSAGSAFGPSISATLISLISRRPSPSSGTGIPRARRFTLALIRLDYNYDVTYSDYPDVWNPPSALAPFRTAAMSKRCTRWARHPPVPDRGLGVTYNISAWRSTAAGFDRKRNYIAAYVTQTF